MAFKNQIARIKKFIIGQYETTPPRSSSSNLVVPDQRDKYIVPSGYQFTPSDVLSYITRAEQGDTRFLYAFMDEMIARDTHLAGELNKAKTALTGADVQILAYPPEYRKQKATAAAKARADAVKKAQPPPPGMTTPKASFADSSSPVGEGGDMPLKIADYVTQQLKAPHVRLDRAIGALSNGIWKGVGAVEVIVEPGKAEGGRERLKALNPIPSQRFRFNPFGTQLLLQLSGDIDDLAAVSDLGARIAVCTIDADKPSAARRGILRSCIGPWLSRMYGPGWWLHFVEVFGSPMRIAKTASNDVETMALLKAALEDLGAHQYAVIPDTAKIELIEAASRSMSLPPHQTLMDFCASEISKALLGATQTSQILSGAGSQASATVHMDVFQALTKARSIEIAATIREQIIMPLVERNFGPDAAAKYCPEIVLSTDIKLDLAALGDFITKAKASGAGKAVPLRWINETGDIPVPEEGEPTLDDAPPPSNILQFPPQPGQPAAAGPNAPKPNGDKNIGDKPVNGDQTGGRAGAAEEEAERFYAEGQEHVPAGSSDGGQWAGGGAGGVASMLADKIASDGGFTYQAVIGTMAHDGYAVSLHASTSMVRNNVSAQDLADFMRTNATLLRDLSNHVGAWHNTKDGKDYLDVSTIVHDAAHAHTLGAAHHQKAYYDLAKGRTVSIGKSHGRAHGLSAVSGKELGTLRFPAGLYARADRQDPDGVEGDTPLAENLAPPAIPTIRHAPGAGEDIVGPVRAIIARGLEEGASLSSILYQIKVRAGLNKGAPLTEDILAAVVAEARFRGMQSAG